MLGKHLICDNCGDITLDATFEEGAYVDIHGSYDYSEVVSEEKRVSNKVKHTDWVREAFPDPDDPIAINFEEFCPDCQ